MRDYPGNSLYMFSSNSCSCTAVLEQWQTEVNAHGIVGCISQPEVICVNARMLLVTTRLTTSMKVGNTTEICLFDVGGIVPSTSRRTREN